LRFDDLLRVSIRQVLRHRRRYLGVVLAIALGVAGFITVVTMGRDLKKNFNQDLVLIGGVTIIKLSFTRTALDQRNEWFRDRTIAALRHLPGVSDVTKVALTWGGQTRQRDHLYSFTLLGVDEAFWDVRGFWPLSGKLFGPEEVERRTRECVLGKDLAHTIFGTQEVEGATLEINHEIYRVAGVLGGIYDSTLGNGALLPVTTVQDRIPEPALTHLLYLRCKTWDDVAPVAAAIPATVNNYQSIDQMQVYVSWEGLKRVQRVSWWVEFFIYLAITATLLLGGVGIWNVMMAAVRSRTREIGLKKAMGAQDRDILAQFLSEALCLSLGSAVIGIALSRLATEILGSYIGSRPPEDLFLIGLVMGFLFAVGLGVGAGLYPSIQASRMEVVSAIRYE
jgi:putative ABC transport system permease protein